MAENNVIMDQANEILENAKECYSKMSSKALEINLIVMNCLEFVLLFISAIMINFEVYFIIIFLFYIPLMILSIINVIFSAHLRHWRRVNLIKKCKKERGICLTNAGFTLKVISLVLDVITGYFFQGFTDNSTIHCNGDLKVHCDEPGVYDVNLVSTAEYVFTLIALSVIQILSLLQFWIWCFLKDRIIKELDEPPSFINVEIQTEEKVIIEQEETIPFNNDDNQNRKNQSIKIIQNQITTEIPDSQELNLK